MSNFPYIELIPENCKQLIVANFNPVTTRGGMGSFWNEDRDGWKLVLENLRINGGKEGTVEAENKKEGDLKTPLGIYRLGVIFGNNIYNDSKFDYPYLKVTNTHFGVDDSNSVYYNRIVDANKVKRDWVSAERMLRDDHQYELGIEIRYNPDNIPEKGSCIYFHVWKSADELSEGCVTTDYASLKNIVDFLDPLANPCILISAQSVSNS